MINKFRENLCFETSEYSVQTADDNSKVISQAIQLTFVLYIYKLVLYFNSTINNNQIKYHLAIIEQIFCRYSIAFTDMLCRFTISYDSLLLKEHVPRTEGSWCLERDCLDHHGERSLKLYYSMKSFT